MALSAEQLAELLKDPAVPWIPWIGGKGAHAVYVSGLLEFLAGANVTTTERDLDTLVEALGGRKADGVKFVWPISAWKRWRGGPSFAPPQYQFPRELPVPSYRQRLHAAGGGTTT